MFEDAAESIVIIGLEMAYGQRNRCPFAQERCRSEVPEFRELAPDHFAACHFPME